MDQGSNRSDQTFSNALLSNALTAREHQFEPPHHAKSRHSAMINKAERVSPNSLAHLNDRVQSAVGLTQPVVGDAHIRCSKQAVRHRQGSLRRIGLKHMAFEGSQQHQHALAICKIVFNQPEDQYSDTEIRDTRFKVQSSCTPQRPISTMA